MTPVTASPAPEPQPARFAAWAGFTFMCLGMFMAILDVQIVATSLPTIQAALRIAPDRMVWIAWGIILLFYVLGRISELRFRLTFGFNQFLWTPFDSALRRVISRRNIILLILSVGAIFYRVDFAFQAVALWCVISIGLQCIRWFQAELTRAAGRPVENWMDARQSADAG